MATAIFTNAYGLDGVEAEQVFEDMGDLPMEFFSSYGDAYAYSRAYGRCVYTQHDCGSCHRWDH